LNSAVVSSWDWDFTADGLTDESGQQVQYNDYTTGGQYPVTLTATTNAGCVKDTVITITATAAPYPVFNIDTASVKLCSNQLVTLTANAVPNGFGTVTKIEIFWDHPNAAPVTDNNPQPGETYSYQYPEFGSPESKTVQVLFRAYSNNDCYRDSVMNL